MRPASRDRATAVFFSYRRSRREPSARTIIPTQNSPFHAIQG